MDLNEVRDLAGAILSIAAVVALALLLPLYLSQRRDVRRMRLWMEGDPEHPGADLEASEAMLDRAEAELEELLEEPPSEPTTGTTPTTPAAPAARVTSERPALTRITMERAALEPHPRWRRFAAQATQPRVLVAAGLATVLVGAAAIFGSEELLSGDGDGAPRRAAAIEPSEVDVAVLNGTTVTGLAGKVGSDVESRGFVLGAVTNTDPGFERTVVLYAPGQKRAAQKVARDLGVRGVEQAGRRERSIAGDADVIVIAGEDRARP